MVSKNEQYIMLWNSFSDIESVSRLVPDELYMWGSLYTMRRYDDKVVINIDLLEQLLPLQYYASRPTINKDRIRHLLVQLKNKKCIHYDVSDELILSKKNDHIALTITLQCWSNKDERYSEGDFVGYEPVSYEKFFDVKDKIDFYIWSAVKRYDKLGGRNCSDDEWAILLDVSDSTARRRVNKLVKEGVIYKKSGRWETKEKQAKNTYNTVPFERKIEENDQEVEENEEKLEVKLDEEVSIDWGNWKDSGVYLNEDDFYLYWKYRDNKEFKDVCDKRLKKIGSNQKLTDWMGNGKARYETEKKKIERDKVLSELVNAIVYKDSSEIISLNRSNIGKIVWDKVDKIYYFMDDGTMSEGEFSRLAAMNGNTNEKEKSYAIEQYKKLVLKGEKLTIEKVNKIREGVKRMM